MRRVTALSFIFALAAGGTAAAENWVSFADIGGGKSWFYDADYAYKDTKSGRVVVMQAIAIPASNVGPSAPGAPDGVGNVVALNCRNSDQILLASYEPKTPLDIDPDWRRERPKKLKSAEDKKLKDAVCALADLPEK